jgi:recombinational DNA repair ATPase RecF
MLDMIKTLDKQLVYYSNEGYGNRQHKTTELQKQIDKLKNKLVGEV